MSYTSLSRLTWTTHGGREPDRCTPHRPGACGATPPRERRGTRFIKSRLKGAPSRVAREARRGGAGREILSRTHELSRLTVTEAAEGLGVSPKTLSSILNCRAGVSPEMAVRLCLAFGTAAESCLNHQLQYDLWPVQKQRKSLRGVKFAA